MLNLTLNRRLDPINWRSCRAMVASFTPGSFASLPTSRESRTVECMAQFQGADSLLPWHHRQYCHPWYNYSQSLSFQPSGREGYR